MRLILDTDLSCPVHSLRYADENASETLNKKGYNHYKFSFMLYTQKFFLGKRELGFYFLCKTKPKQQGSSTHHTLTPLYNQSCPWLPLARRGSTPVSTILRKSVTFLTFFIKKKHSKLQSFIQGKWNWLISCLNDSETQYLF